MDNTRKKQMKQAQRALEELLKSIGELYQEHHDEATDSITTTIHVDRASLKGVFESYRRLVG